MVLPMTLNWKRIENNAVAMGILDGLINAGDPTDGYTIMTEPARGMGVGDHGHWTYDQAKNALQMMRDEGFLDVVRSTKADNKAKWVAYQVFWLSTETEKWWMTREESEVKEWETTFKELSALMRRIGGNRVGIKVDMLDDVTKRRVLRLGMASGHIRVSVSVTESGAEWLGSLDVE